MSAAWLLAHSTCDGCRSHGDTYRCSSSLLLVARRPPGVPVSPLLFWLQPGVNPAALEFLSNISELLNWTERLRLYSVPASLGHVFGLVVLLKQEGLPAAFRLNRRVLRAALSLLPKRQSSGTALRDTAVDGHPRHKYTYLDIFSRCFTIGANNAIPVARFWYLLSRGLGAGTAAQAAAPQKCARAKPCSTAQPQPSQIPGQEISAHS